jgi:hypothetical protein
MTEIIEAIDSWTANRYSSYTQKLWGFCELMHKSANGKEQVMPVTIPERKQVSLDDKYQFITWIRWADILNYEQDDDWSFGKIEQQRAKLPLRIVLAHKVSLGENIAFDFVQNLPNQFKITGFKFVFVGDRPSIDPNHEAIYITELSDTVYEKHRFDWNIYIINLGIEYIVCLSNEVVPSTSNSLDYSLDFAL